MRYFPLFLALDGRRTLVVDGHASPGRSPNGWQGTFRPALAGWLARLATSLRQVARRPVAGDAARVLSPADGAAMPAECGGVAIVGAGPGDPELLTLKALRRLERADVVVHDRLVSDEIMDYIRPEAERVYVGKAPGAPAMGQAEINALIADRALAGKRVVRLKGGDPFVFGRGGEEMDYLRARGIRTEIVPGITAATGCAAAAGIPLTHRDHASAVTFATGHAKADADDPDWAALAAPGQTLVIYMGVRAAGRIARRLMANGLDGATPVGVVENGTTTAQRVLTSRLDSLEADMDAGAVAPPALLIVGQVAAYADAAAEASHARAEAA